MAFSTIICAHCDQPAEKRNGDIARARKIGAPIYCGKVCSGLARKQWKPDAQKKEEKAVYDMIRRAKLADQLKAEKAARHLRTYDPVKAAVERKKRMPKHVEYCRRPEYRAKKSKYDRRHRAERDFGEYAESFLLILDINNEVLNRSTRYEIDLENGKLNKTTRRKREYLRIVGGQSQEGALGHPERNQVGHDAPRAG